MQMLKGLRKARALCSHLQEGAPPFSYLCLGMLRRCILWKLEDCPGPHGELLRNSMLLGSYQVGQEELLSWLLARRSHGSLEMCVCVRLNL